MLCPTPAPSVVQSDGGYTHHPTPQLQRHPLHIGNLRMNGPMPKRQRHPGRSPHRLFARALHEFFSRTCVQHRDDHISNLFRGLASAGNAAIKIIKRHSLFSPANGRLQVNASLKSGSRYGCGVQLNCRIFSTLASYLRIAALLLYTSR